jgi:hypothetical protein
VLVVPVPEVISEVVDLEMPEMLGVLVAGYIFVETEVLPQEDSHPVELVEGVATELLLQIVDSAGVPLGTVVGIGEPGLEV